jgi:thiol-disulfide isomerase/thioredoxin
VTLEYDFTVVDGNGKSVKLSDYVGKPIVLNFWASWCGPCKSEMPEFQQVFAEMGEQVQFLMVNATASDTMADAKSFINQYGYTFPVVFDTRGEALYTYGVDAFPTTFFLDKTGTVAGYVVGAISKGTLLKGIGMITK